MFKAVVPSVLLFAMTGLRPALAEGAGVIARPPQAPPVTYALLPGYWQLRGANYVWVPPETTLRRVEKRPYVQGRYVWRDDAWVWVPAHYEGD
jgi:hypothetical protein